MTQKHKIFNLVVEKIGVGMRPSEAIVTIRDAEGRKDFLRVERDFLANIGGRYYLPVALIHEDGPQGRMLVELPQESEIGANRIWVRVTDVHILEK